MLYAFGFKRLGVVASDLYFLDPHPGPGQEGAERGVRMEIRFIERPEHQGSIYASRPINLDRPVWRVDLLESIEHPGSLDRAHHHPKMTGYEPGRRKFEPELTADPIAWVEKRLENVEELLQSAGMGDEELEKEDIEELRAASPEILAAVRRLFDGISAGELAQAPENPGELTLIRSGWL